MPSGHATIQVLHDPDRHADAQHLLRALSGQAQRLRLPINVQLLNTGDRSSTAIVQLLLGAGHQAEGMVTLAAAVDGGVLLPDIDDVQQAADWIVASALTTLEHPQIRDPRALRLHHGRHE
jgi:hypothetical protein